MQPVVHHPLRSSWKLVVAAALLALAVIAPSASAKITKATSSYYQLNGTAPVTGFALSGYQASDTIYAAVQASGSAATVAVPTKYQTGLTLPFGYTSYSGSQIAFVGPATTVSTALKNLEISAGNLPYDATGTANNVNVTVTAFKETAGVTYNPTNQHFYQYVSAANTPWRDVNTTKGANTLAGETSQLGLTGYLATVTDADENAFIANKIQGAAGYPAKNVWIGANDIGSEGKWVWSGGPEKDVQFWEGNQTGSPVEGRYSSWGTGEPNNYNNGGAYDTGENCAVINKLNIGANISTLVPGLWNDLPCNIGAVGTPNTIEGYIVEFGNKPVGGDFTGVDIASSTFKARPYVPKVTPNFFDKVFNLLFTSKKRKNLPKKPNKPATFTFTTKMLMVNPGTYVVSVKRKDGEGVPYMLLPGSAAQATGGKKVTLGSTRWSIEVTTTKANQRVTIDPVLKTQDWLKPSGTKISVTLKTDSNMRCPLGWCESTPIPSPKDQGKVK